jgi:hypothetical protein
MSEFIERPYSAAASRIDPGCFGAKDRAQRLWRAWRYFTGQLSADDAQTVMLDCERPAGWHPLLILTVDEALEQAREIFADRPDLRRLIADGCARVGHKWESYNDELYEARRWAIELAQEYAAGEGLPLVRLQESGALPDVKDASAAAEGGAP